MNRQEIELALRTNHEQRRQLDLHRRSLAQSDRIELPDRRFRDPADRSIFHLHQGRFRYESRDSNGRVMRTGASESSCVQCDGILGKNRQEVPHCAQLTDDAEEGRRAWIRNAVEAIRSNEEEAQRLLALLEHCYGTQRKLT